MNSNTIVIIGGSFQGKSIISIKIAEILNYSAVICTDLLRNILHIQNPTNDTFSTSTYLLSKEKLDKQKQYVSTLALKVLDVYDKRGEKVILEGMHFSRQCIDDLLGRGTSLFFLANQLSFKERTESKTITRTKLNSYSPQQPDWFLQSSYYKHQERIQEIHHELEEICKELRIPIVQFSTINQAVKLILETLYSKVN